MTQFINDILNDFDAEFGLDKYSSFSQQESPRKSPVSSRSPYQSPLRSDISATPSFSAQYHIPEKPVQFRQEAYVPKVQPPTPMAIPPQVATPEPPVKQEIQEPPVVPKVQRISIDQASQIIADLKKERVKDAEKMQQLQTENARLVAKLTILEHTDLRVAELGSKVEQLLQKYLESEQIKTQQASQIAELRQEIIVLKSRMNH